MPLLRASGTGISRRGKKSPCPRCTQEAQELAIVAKRGKHHGVIDLSRAHDTGKLHCCTPRPPLHA